MSAKEIIFAALLLIACINFGQLQECPPGYEPRYSCITGYALESDTATRYDDGTFQPPRCFRIFCDPIRHPDNGTSSCSKATTEYGGKCNLTCDDGFVNQDYRKNKSATCDQIADKDGIVRSRKGIWKDVATCSKIYCDPIPHPRNGTSSCSNTTTEYGRKCNLTCHNDQWKSKSVRCNQIVDKGGDVTSQKGIWEVVSSSPTTDTTAFALMSNGYWYHASSNTINHGMDVTDAIDICMKLGSDISYIGMKSALIRREIIASGILDRNKEYLIGALFSSQGEGFIWRDGFRLEAIEWMEGKPSNQTSHESCVAWLYTNNAWVFNNIGCYRSFLEPPIAVLCEKESFC